MRKLNPTQNPVPSSDVRDLPFNASKIDEVVNSDENIYTDRLGNDRFTIKGLEESAVSAGPTVEAAVKALEQAKEAKKNSDAIKADTGNYIRRAETAADASKSAASNSEASAIRSESAAAKAESIADAAGTYPDIAAGLAATEVGQYFRVPQGEGSTVSFIYYRNNAGVAEKATEQPSAQYVEKVRIESTMPQGRLLAAISAALNLINDLTDEGDSRYDDITERLSQLSESALKNDNAIQSISMAVSILTEAMTLLKSHREAENEKMSVMTSLSMLIESLAPLDGFDPQNIIAGTGANVQKFEGAYIAKAPSAVVRIDIETDSNIPSSKEDGKVKCQCKINIDGVEFSAYSTMAVQGSSAVHFPKKNLTLAFFKDENYDKNIELKIGDGIPHDEWVYKANYVDSTHLKNLFGYRFWEKIRDSRNTWPQREIDFYYEGRTGSDAIDTGATGLPKGYPCVLYVNSAFYGIGDITIGKKRKNYNMAKDKPNNIYLALNNCDLLTLKVDDESVLEIKTPKTITDEFNGYIQGWRDFANLGQTAFTAALPSKLNPLNVIDYYILVQTLCLSDCLNRNVLMQTWDGNKWFFMPYDLKGNLGINPQGNALLDYDFDPVVDGSIHQGTKDFWIKVKTALQAEMNSRYKGLRDQNIISHSCVAGILNELHSKRTERMFKSEWTKWSGLPSKNISSMNQMMTWFSDRITWLDVHFSYTTSK